MTEHDCPSPDFVGFQRRMARMMFVFMGLLFCGLIGRLLHINTSMAPRLSAIASAQQESQRIIPARRGSILDAHGRLLAGSKLRYSVYADPGLIERPEEVARSLAPVLEIEAGRIENEIRTSGAPRFCWLKRRVDDAQGEAIRRLNLAGIGLRSEFERHWPMKETAAQVLGFVGADGCGLEGLELVHDDHLKGLPGRHSTLRDARRRAIGQGRLSAVEPRDGGHLLLTIDSVIQTMVQTRLRRQIEHHGAKGGIAIVMSPKTGDILALACEPTFDLNRYGHYDKARWRNRAITDPVEPGSTFKPFVLAGAVEGNYVSTTEMIDCHDGLHYFGNRRMHDTSPHGLMTIRDIVVYSSNIGMGIIGTRMGNAALHDIITRFGCGSLTQVDLPGENAGIVLPVERWTSYSTTSVTMGQELAVTPLQLATAFCVLVNRGFLLRPRIVRAKLAVDLTPLETREGPDVVRRVLAEEVAAYLAKEVLTGVVKRGGKELNVSPYTMCGKTGTAQVPYKDRRGYEPEAYLCSFVGAAPAANPQIVTLVMIRKPDPSRGHYGRVVAGPAVRDIVRATLEYLQVPPDATLASSVH